MVPWTTVEMSTGFSTRKMRRGATRSSSSTVPRTTARASTLSAKQQRLREVAACLPMWYSYGNEHPVHLLHPRMTALREECQPVSKASSPGQSDCIIVFIPARSANIYLQIEWTVPHWAVTPKYSNHSLVIFIWSC